MRTHSKASTPANLLLLLVAPLIAQLAAAPAVSAQAGEPVADDATIDVALLAAPTGMHPPVQDYFLLRLAGDETDFRYAPGALDRAANLQTRLELTSRLYRKWTKIDIAPRVLVVGRETWEQTPYEVVYGLPVRIDERALVVPAQGDRETVALWTALLDGHLPVIDGFLFRGSPQEAATLMLADVLVQRAAGAMWMDAAGIEVELPWVRELAIHIASLAILAKIEPGRVSTVDAVYHVLAERHPTGSLSARDFRPDLPLGDWLWFQAQFHAGARAVLESTDLKDGVQSLRALAKKGGGTLTVEALLRKHRRLSDWLHDRFTTVSTR